MMNSIRFFAPVVAAFVTTATAASAASYALQRTYNASNFASAFAFRTSTGDYADMNGDPTNGFVNYVDAATAKSQGLFRVLKGTGAQGQDQVLVGVDNTTVVSTSSDVSAAAVGKGRNSVRLESLDTFDTGLLVADIAHMPGNQCGVWPALWVYNFAEDPIGEIDIIEGINHQAANIISLHTCDSCKFTAGGSNSPLRHTRAASSIMTGTDLRSNCALGGDCDANSKNFDGCGVTATETASYGDAFNAAGGGVYVLQLEKSTGGSNSGIIKIWHFSRSNVPADITSGKPDPSSWGLPMGAFEQQNGGCNVGKLFHDETIIINIDFCGDDETDDEWSADGACSKYKSCTDFVAKNPAQFSESYWLFNSIKLYQTSN